MGKKATIYCKICGDDHITSTQYAYKLIAVKRDYICTDCKHELRKSKVFSQLNGINHTNWAKYNINNGE
jgi:hypothetical protein